MQALSEHLKDILVDEGIVSSTPTAEWAVQIGRFADTPDQLVCLRDVPSGGPIYLMDSSTLQNDVCNAVIRSNDYLTGYNKASDVSEALELTSVKSIDNVTYWAVRRNSSIAYLDTDSKGRNLFEVSFSVQREK